MAVDVRHHEIAVGSDFADHLFAPLQSRKIFRIIGIEGINIPIVPMHGHTCITDLFPDPVISRLHLRRRTGNIDPQFDITVMLRQIGPVPQQPLLQPRLMLRPVQVEFRRSPLVADR